MQKTNNSLDQLIDNAYAEIDDFRLKLGEIAFDAIMEEDNFTYDMAKGIISTFELCTTEREYDIANMMLTGICGYGLETLLNRIRERDKQGYFWESCGRTVREE